MYCTHCGTQVDERANYCFQCGGATPNVRPRTAGKTLSRSREDVKIAGVCAGFANYFKLDVTLVRILWAVLTIYPPGAGLIAYIVCWITMPRSPEPVQSNVSSTVPV
ncbi:MAG: PspC domain-containing protein [Bryobacterales bacterium]|nr:PspC domain-containing protein [Bryobacterales bacterium]MBV9400559.1 PspC domain-containing protein [Bryobacterales bacterium]